MSSDATSELGTQVEAARLAALAQIASATDAAMVTKIGSELSGKKSVLNTLRASLGKIQDPEARKVAGQLINESAQQVEAALQQRTQEFLVQERAAQVASESLDLTEFVTANRRGNSHIVTQAMQRLEDVFIGLGFQVAEGPEVETDFYNFEALNMPRTHPARSEFDTMFIEPFSSEHEANTVLLRTHTSPVQIRVMQSWEPPIYAIMPGRVFRRDTPDATHMPVFHQIEGLVIDRDITFAHLAGIIESFTKAFLVANLQADYDLHSFRSPSHLPSSISNDRTVTGSNWAAAEWCTQMCCEQVALTRTNTQALHLDSVSTVWPKSATMSRTSARCTPMTCAS